MKKILLAIAMLATISIHAQSDKYTAAMEKNLQILDSATSTAQWIAVSYTFERIGDAEKTQWLPYYYAALAQIQIGFTDKKADKDAVGTKANELIMKGESIEKNAELYSLRNMVATIQLLVSPQERWKTYGAQAAEAIQEGLKLDPNNPRLYFLQGTSLFNKPEFIGGGKSKAKPMFEKALQLYTIEKQKPESILPTWGKNETEMYLKRCL